MTTDTKPQLEFSRPFNSDKLQDASRQENLTANASERAALAKRFGIVSIEVFNAEITLSRVPNEPRVIDVRGTLQAVVTQNSVVTGEPVTQTVSDTFDTMFASEGYVERWLRDNPHDEYEAPEPLDNGWLDMGELVAQYLSLALDEYPREANLPFMGDEDEPAPDKEPSPFAVLARLKQD